MIVSKYVSFENPQPLTYASLADQNSQCWLLRGHHAQYPGVLRESIFQHTSISSVYVVDNLPPYDVYVSFRDPDTSMLGALTQPVNHPQTLDTHLGNSYGSRCYRSPWKVGEKETGMFAEPTMLMAGDGQGKVCFDPNGEMCETLLSWKFNYFYDVEKYGQAMTSEKERYQLLPQDEWLKENDDPKKIAEKVEEAKKLNHKGKGMGI